MPAKQQPDNLQDLIKLITEENSTAESENPAATQGASGGAALGPYAFGFEYAGLLFRAEALAGGQPQVRLTAEIGRLPYSIEGPELRRGLLRLIAASHDLPRGRLYLDPDSMIRLRAQTAPPGCSASDPVSVIATSVALLLDFKPHLELMAELLESHEQRRPKRGAA